MNGWALGGLVCVIYTLAVGGLALKKSPGLIKIVKMKMGKKMTDEGAIKLSLVAAGVVGAFGIFCFIMAAMA